MIPFEQGSSVPRKDYPLTPNCGKTVGRFERNVEAPSDLTKVIQKEGRKRGSKPQV